LRELPSRRFECAIIVAAAQEGNHGTAGVTGAGIVDDRLKAIAHFDAVFPLRRGNKQQNAAIILFAADAQMLVKVNGVRFDRFSFE
jgi:hypothetical protein